MYNFHFFHQLFDIQNCERIIKYYADANVEDSKLCQLVLKKWAVLQELVKVLGIACNATIYFQTKDITLSDVFGRWMGMQLHFEHLTKKRSITGLAKHLLTAANTRKERIFNNPLMGCALFLDPRFHFEISKYEQKVEDAKRNMLTIWRRLNFLCSNDIAVETETNNTSSGSLESEFDEMDALANHLQRGSRNNVPQHENVHDQNCSSDIETIIDLYEPNPIGLNSNILKHWECVKEEHPELYRIAMVVFSIPPSEVQIERDFSHLDCVFTKRRCSLTQSRLEEIFIIHLNKDLFKTVMNEEVNELINALEFKQTSKADTSKQCLKF